MKPVELLVIGGGTAGIVGAKTAAGLGARVCLVEAERTGGDCLWTGCVPSKALLAAAHAAADAAAAGRLGVHAPAQVEFAQVRAHVRAAIAAIEPVDSPEALRAAGVEVRIGDARFAARDAVQVDGEHITFRRALIATGSAPAVPSIPGLDTARAVTNETVWDLAELPSRLLVLGAGSVGCELGQAFARLGSAVTIVEPQSAVLPGADPAAAHVLAKALADDGVAVRSGTRVVSITDGVATLADRSQVSFDAVLLATGRIARTDGLGLDKAGVVTDAADAVVVDAQLSTSNDRVWAAGDVTGLPRFTHVAGVHASTAASNAVLGLRRKADTVVPRVTFTRPEIAAVGVSPADADGDPTLRVRTVHDNDVDRAVTDAGTGGFTSLVLDRRGRVVGASVVGPRAGEALAEAVLAVRQGLRARDLAAAMHAYPTYVDGVWKAAIADVQADLGKPVARAGIALLRRLRTFR